MFAYRLAPQAVSGSRRKHWDARTARALAARAGMLSLLLLSSVRGRVKNAPAALGVNVELLRHKEDGAAQTVAVTEESAADKEAAAAAVAQAPKEKE